MYAAFLNVLMNSRMEKNQIEELPIPENPDFETARCSGLGELHPGKNVIKVQQYFEYLNPNPGTAEGDSMHRLYLGQGYPHGNRGK